MSAPQPAKGRPARISLEGRFVRLEPIGREHAADLFAVAGPERHRWLFDYPPETEAALADQLAAMAAADDPLMYAVINKATGCCEGRQSFMRMVPEHGSIEIGNVLWGDRMARTRLATDALYVFARHAFDELGYRRFEWKCNNRNEPSKRAAQRFGFAFEGVFRQHLIVKGESRDTAWFAMIDGDWPRLRAGFERWLTPVNFDANGNQLSKLSF